MWFEAGKEFSLPDYQSSPLLNAGISESLVSYCLKWDCSNLGHLFEMHILRPHTRPLELESSKKESESILASQVILADHTLKFENHHSVQYRNLISY